MTTGFWVLAGYAVLMIAGGLMGHRAGSKASLYAGLGSGAALLAALVVAHGAPAAGFWAGCAIAALLVAVFAHRWSRTGKFMPSGMLLVLSVVAAILLGHSAWTVGS